MGEFFESLIPLIMIAMVFTILIGVPILAIRMIRTKPEKKFRKVYDGIEIKKEPQPDLIELRYHTYDGVLLWFMQTEHHVYVEPDDAHELLKRLLRYNLTHGLLAYGGLLVPLVAIPSYYSQKKSIARQVSEARKASRKRTKSTTED